MENIEPQEELQEEPQKQEDIAGRAPAVINIAMNTADTEYSYQFPKNVKKFLIQCRDGTAFRIAFRPGKVAHPTPPYFSILASTSYYEDHLNIEKLRIYFACAVGDKVVEIIAWN